MRDLLLIVNRSAVRQNTFPDGDGIVRPPDHLLVVSAADMVLLKRRSS
jgi:hypothetical protein